MLYDWLQNWGDAIDWSKGVMGMPFSAEYFSGRSVYDYSKRFYGL